MDQINVGKLVRVQLPNGKTFEGEVTRVWPLSEGGRTGVLDSLLFKRIGMRYTIECPTCSHEIQADVCSTMEVISE